MWSKGEERLTHQDDVEADRPFGVCFQCLEAVMRFLVFDLVSLQEGCEKLDASVSNYSHPLLLTMVECIPFD